MTYRQITTEERYMLSTLRKQGCSTYQIARLMGRHPSTIYREVRRNACPNGAYRVSKAISRANGRRKRSRRNQRIDAADWSRVEALIQRQWSPEQIAGALRKQGELQISHETIYRHVWQDKKAGGQLHKHLRGSAKQRRKRHNTYDSRGRLAGKRMIEDRPAAVEQRQMVGHWEADTVMGSGDKHCILTLVERATGQVEIGKLRNRTKAELTARMIKLIRKQKRPVLTITADNGTEFHDYASIEKATGVKFYFANPYHSWERGTNENTNGLIRQYLPKRKSMAHLDQWDCNDIATKLNLRPRKRLGFSTPGKCYETYL